MAEHVPFHVEDTICETEEMEGIGLFSKIEIEKVIKRRKALECALKQKSKKRINYLNYIEYEVAVLNLVEKRRKRMKCYSKKKEIDFSIARRINKLFKAAVRRFRNDVQLWLSQIEFCKRMKWHRAISGLFARMLQVHSTNPGLWVLAAQWQMEENNELENARQLLQKAVRIHPQSQLIWTEYFQMELMYTDLVLKRREMLNAQEITGTGNVTDAVLDECVALLVYKDAVKAIPDVNFALSLISICQQFNFTCNHIEEIIHDIQTRHPNAEETLDAVARRPLSSIMMENAKTGKLERKGKREAEQQAFGLYEEALEKVQSEKMWTFYIKFAVNSMESAKKDKRKTKMYTKVVELMERASEASYLLLDFYPYWAKLMQSRGDEEAALSVALIACKKWPKRLDPWVFCLTLHIQTCQNRELISELFDEALLNVKQKHSLRVWQLAVQWQSIVNPSELSTIFEKAILAHRNVSIPMKEAYLEMVALREGAAAARDLYKRLRYLIPTSLEFYMKMVEIEKAQLNPSICWLRNYYEDAVKEFGKNSVDLWLNYMMWEAEYLDCDQTIIEMLHWRAMKTLEENHIEDYMTRFTLSTTGHDSSSFFQQSAFE